MSRSVSKLDTIIVIIFMGLTGIGLLVVAIWQATIAVPYLSWEPVEAVQEDHNCIITGSSGGRGGTQHYTVKCDVKLDYTFHGIPYTTTIKHSPTKDDSGQNTTAKWYINPNNPTEATDVIGNFKTIGWSLLFSLICLIPAGLMLKGLREGRH